MANTEGKSSSTHQEMKEETSNSLVPPSAPNKCDPAEEELELQFLNAQIHESGSKILANANKKKSFFQITSVTENVNDENDSMDELDESRADDLSSADLSNMSKMSLQTDVEHSDADDPAITVGVCLNPNYAATNPNSEANGNGPSRFKLVKVARIEPIKRGRWTCKDFLTEPQPAGECSAPKAEQMKDNVSGSSSAASSVHFVPGENPSTDNPLGDLSSAAQQPVPPSSEKAKDGKRMKRDSFASLTRDRTGSKGTFSKDHLRKESSDLPSLKDSLNVDTDNQSESDDSTSATGGAIDNKIEQAMDLVKSHLLFAVREEVEVLKEQINELLDKNEQLQRENSLLRQTQTQGLPHHPYSQSETPQVNRLVNTTANTQDQGGFPSMAGGGAPRTDGGGFTQQSQAPPPSDQFAGMQAAGGPTHAQQASSQQQALPQQQASQYGHIQSQQTPQHSIPQQTTTQHAQPPSQT
ncbi:uncharacterized protein [Asterias amurensis]|uniref:uncharacterized protein n=1 Tax=Asterias amurensis TaxID=7602 RepID=UPI003AB21742